MLIMRDVVVGNQSRAFKNSGFCSVVDYQWKYFYSSAYECLNAILILPNHDTVEP